MFICSVAPTDLYTVDGQQTFRLALKHITLEPERNTYGPAGRWNSYIPKNTLTGISGIVCSLLPISGETAGDISPKINNMHIIVAGIAAYVILLLVTRVVFNRVVTTELMLIVGWTMLEISVINRLNASDVLSDSQVVAMSVITGAAFIISMVLYVAYYRMEDMKAFYAAMVPLVTEAITMGTLLGMALH